MALQINEYDHLQFEKYVDFLNDDLYDLFLILNINDCVEKNFWFEKNKYLNTEQRTLLLTAEYLIA